MGTPKSKTVGRKLLQQQRPSDADTIRRTRMEAQSMLRQPLSIPRNVGRMERRMASLEKIGCKAVKVVVRRET